MLDNSAVSIFRDAGAYYPQDAPFHAGEAYPEYPFTGATHLDPSNKVYGAVRESLRLLALDADKFGSPAWNPFGAFIAPGDAVVIKPNAVSDINQNRAETVFASITHGAVLRAVIDYAYKALDGRGKLTVADAPLAHSNFENWKKLMGLDQIVELYRERFGFEIEVHDLRNLYVPWDYEHGFAPSHLRKRAARDPAGYVEVDLRETSEFAEFSTEDVRLMYGSDFKREQTVQHHLNGHHRYYVAKSVLDADVLISVPKMKTHQKVGVTLNIKGMVGTQGDKNYIPHYRIGDPSRGGDEYPDQGALQNALNRSRIWMYTELLGRETKAADLAFKALGRVHHTGQRAVEWRGLRKHGRDNYLWNITGGAWHGNDTAWRMTLDLMRIVLYSNAKGEICETPQRKFFSIIDGITGGEKDGPLAPSAKHCGAIIAGFNPLAVDAVTARLMGYDPRKIKMLAEGLRRSWLKFSDEALHNVRIASNLSSYEAMMSNETDPFLQFETSQGWRGHIEINSAR